MCRIAHAGVGVRIGRRSPSIGPRGLMKGCIRITTHCFSRFSRLIGEKAPYGKAAVIFPKQIINQKARKAYKSKNVRLLARCLKYTIVYVFIYTWNCQKNTPARPIPSGPIPFNRVRGCTRAYSRITTADGADIPITSQVCGEASMRDPYWAPV